MAGFAPAAEQPALGGVKALGQSRTMIFFQRESPSLCSAQSPAAASTVSQKLLSLGGQASPRAGPPAPSLPSPAFAVVPRGPASPARWAWAWRSIFHAQPKPGSPMPQRRMGSTYHGSAPAASVRSVPVLRYSDLPKKSLPLFPVEFA